MAKNYSKVPLKVQKKSGFDKSFQNLFTGKVGTIIPILTKDIFIDTIVHNEAVGEIGLNWYDTITIPNNASIDYIEKSIKEAKELFDKNT